MRASSSIKYLHRIQKYRKYKRKRSSRRQQWGGFLNRYDFAYAGTDTVNTAMKGSDNCAPKLISQTLTETDKIAEVRIKQAINSGGQQIQKIAPQTIWGAIEDVYKTQFKLLGKLGKQTFLQLKRKLSKIF